MQKAAHSPKPIIHIDVGGRQRPLRFGQNALGDFCDVRAITLAEMGDRLQAARLNDLKVLLWAGLKDGARKEGLSFDATPDDVGDWIDEDGQGVYEAVFAHFVASQPQEEEKGPEKEGKGKGARKK